MIWETEET